jgi:hypothetical protein
MLKAARRFATLAMICTATTTFAADSDEKQIWACAALGAEEEDLWLVQWGDRSYVKLYDARIWGNHYQDGGDLRWDFGVGAGGTANFSAVLKPDLSLDYYDFRDAKPGEAVAPGYQYQCRLVQD